MAAKSHPKPDLPVSVLSFRMKSRVRAAVHQASSPWSPSNLTWTQCCPSLIRGPAPREGDSQRAWGRAPQPSHTAPSQQRGGRWCEVSPDGSFSARLNRVWDQPPEPAFLRPSLRPGCSWGFLSLLPKFCGSPAPSLAVLFLPGGGALPHRPWVAWGSGLHLLRRPSLVAQVAAPARAQGHSKHLTRSFQNRPWARLRPSLTSSCER